MTLVDVSGDGAACRYNDIVGYGYPFQNGASAANPYVIADVYGARVVDYVAFAIDYVVKIGVHNQNIPR